LGKMLVGENCAGIGCVPMGRDLILGNVFSTDMASRWDAIEFFRYLTQSVGELRSHAEHERDG
jgi:hypothetical protein